MHRSLFLLFLALALSSFHAQAKHDLATATIVLPAGLTGPEQAASEMLVEEVERRCYLRWPVSDHLPPDGQPAIVLGPRAALLHDFPALASHLKSEGSDRPEGYQIVSLPSGTIIVSGNDARGVLFGAGRLLRLLDYSRAGVVLPDAVNLITAPRYALRGHELCYRPKTNAYDGWTVAMYEQYIRDLIAYGTNAIEMAPPRSDDMPDSPHYTLDQMQMDIAVSRLAQKYGLEFWMWYPTYDYREFTGPLKDYSKPETVAIALKEWAEVLRQLPRLDALYVPGGDPGFTPPKYLFPLIEKQAAQLRTFQPNVKIWLSNQMFDAAQTADYYAYLAKEPTWIDGIVFGPWEVDSAKDLRARIPKRYPIRAVPDITHDFRSHYPLPDWDFGYAATEHREAINPRPVDFNAIFHQVLPYTQAGFITYSEGCNDDLNKIVWSSLGWDPDADINDIVHDYAHYFIGGKDADEFAKGLFALERDWRGPLATNENVYPTLELFQKLERSGSPELLHNWRFEMGLYRAYYDATDRARLISETAQEEKAIAALREAGKSGSLAAIADAEKALTDPLPSPTPPGTDWHAWRARVFEIAEGLFQTIHMQLSVPRYQAEAPERGANLDLIDHPLNDRPWIEDRFTEIKALGSEAERLKRLDEVITWCTRGPVMSGPLDCTFRGLDKATHYYLQATYDGRNDDLSPDPMKVRLTANDKVEIAPMEDPRDSGTVGCGVTGGIGTCPVVYDVPAAATASGEMKLTWTPSPGPGNGSGLQVREIWLVPNKKPSLVVSPYNKSGSPYPN
jgi:hypothetical protein